MVLVRVVQGLPLFLGNQKSYQRMLLPSSHGLYVVSVAHMFMSDVSDVTKMVSLMIHNMCTSHRKTLFVWDEEEEYHHRLLKILPQIDQLNANQWIN
ncbi:unnamed protein product [Camellia sinensis]